MAPKPKSLRKDGGDEAKITPTKEQNEIAKYLRFNCPTNTTLYQENEAHYFSGNKAVDALLNSKYGNKAKGDAKFADRQACIYYIQELMNLGMFFRARKLVSKKDKEKKKDKKDSDVSASEQDDKKDENQVAKYEKKDENQVAKDEKKSDQNEKKKKKVKLEYHPNQIFLDDKDVYVWVFDPTPLWKQLVGLGMVLVTVAGCCFPLWPMWMRQGVWYLSMAGLGAFGLILVTAILRTILFGVIWLVTGGQHKLWILPNLTEDCGFFESFQPWYTYEYCPRNSQSSTDEKKKDKQKKQKDSDNENETPAEKEEKEKRDNANENSSASDEERDSTEENSASDSEVSQNSAPSSPESSTQPRKRRPRRADDGFVHVK